MTKTIIAGLETHVELLTQSKIFCACANRFGGEPNSRCCPVCTGQPGALPRLNRQVVRHAVLAGLATGCTVNPLSHMDRKHYSYPDLPKGYQITQHKQPLCKNGHIDLDSGKRIRIARIHIEEDAGKSLHRNGVRYIDYNRAGVPLIELVSEPDFATADEVCEYLEKLQSLVRYLGISDGKMQEGSLRCDVNISLRGEDGLPGPRTEIKNLNSFGHIRRAMAHEAARQLALAQSGQSVAQETRRYDEKTGVTHAMRGKEAGHDYRYLREPNLPTIAISADDVETLRRQLPELPWQKSRRYIQVMGLPAKDAWNLARHRSIAEYFDAAALGMAEPRIVANLILGPLFSSLKAQEQRENFAPLTRPEQLRELAQMQANKKISAQQAREALGQMLSGGQPAAAFVQCAQAISPAELEALCRRAIADQCDAANDYRAGKKNALQAIIGAVMRQSAGRADARQAAQIIKDLLKT